MHNRKRAHSWLGWTAVSKRSHDAREIDRGLNVFESKPSRVVSNATPVSLECPYTSSASPCLSFLQPCIVVSQNPEHLLLFAAGNEGDPEEIGRTTCTINIPGIGKNVLAVGASSSGSTRWPLTADDGEIIEYYGLDHADIDTVSFFSSYGLTRDSRIKPEVVAPGDQVRLYAQCFGSSGSVVLGTWCFCRSSVPEVASLSCTVSVRYDLYPGGAKIRSVDPSCHHRLSRRRLEHMCSFPLPSLLSSHRCSPPEATERTATVAS